MKGRKALMMHMVPRDCASSNRSEDREVPSAARSDRRCSRDGKIAGPGC